MKTKYCFSCGNHKNKAAFDDDSPKPKCKICIEKIKYSMSKKGIRSHEMANKRHQRQYLKSVYLTPKDRRYKDCEQVGMPKRKREVLA